MPMNLPNKLTIVRIIMIPFFVFFLLTDFVAGSKWIATVLFCAASLTDFLDGHIARKYNLVTNFGKFMDPLADKMLAASYWGKFKTNFQMFAIILLMLNLGENFPAYAGGIHIVEQILVYIALILTIVSLVDYLAKNIDVLKEGGNEK